MKEAGIALRVLRDAKKRSGSASDQLELTRPRDKKTTRGTASASSSATERRPIQIVSAIPLDADDVVHQSFGDRLLHGRDAELSLGVLGVKDHRSPADAYDFRGIRSALSASRPLQAGPLALGQAGAKRRDRNPSYVAQLRMQVDRNEM
jgi:hypothetical protein